MTKRTRIVALFLAAVLFFAMMLSVFEITHESEHECLGNRCQICQQMQSARDNLKNLAVGMIVAVAVLVLTYSGYRVVRCFAKPLVQGTLVALKVELLN